MDLLRVCIPVRNCSGNAYGERCGTWHQGMAPYQPTVLTKTKVVRVRSSFTFLNKKSKNSAISVSWTQYESK
jgi:hypothetical protein